MGHDGSRITAFDGQINKKGLALTRSTFSDELGTYVHAAGASFRQGQFATYDANGYVVAATGTGVIGMFKWGNASFGTAVKVDVPIVLNGTTATSVGKANISNVAVRATADFGTAYTVTTDYTVSATAGTITRVALGSIGDGDTVYVTFTYALTDADFEIDGRSFRNNNNDFVSGHGDTSGGTNNVNIISGWSRIFSAEYDTSADYGLTSDFKLYCSSTGVATSASGTDFVGRVCQVPTADDPFLGITAHGNPVA